MLSLPFSRLNAVFAPKLTSETLLRCWIKFFELRESVVDFGFASSHLPIKRFFLVAAVADYFVFSRDLAHLWYLEIAVKFVSNV